MKRSLTILACFGLALTAPAVDPSFTQTIPAGGQRGAEVQVRLLGNRIDDAQEVLFYQPGISVTKIEQVKDKEGKVNDNEVRVTFKIAPDARLGEHALRIRTAGGLSPVQTFFVGTLPNVDEKEPNSEFDKAQKIDLNSTVEGRIESEDVDYYLVEAKKGQRLAVEVEGIRLGYMLLDPYVAIQQMDGKVLAENDDSALFVQDPVISTVAPEDGNYIVQVRESSYGGGGRSYYRAHIGSFPRPLAAYPAGGKVGDNIKVKFLGDATGEFEHEVKLPSAPNEKNGLEVKKDNLVAPSALPFRVSPFPNVLEAEPNNEHKQATATDLYAPVALNGVLAEKGDVDFFRFKAKKGQNFDVNFYARRIGSSLDPVLNIYDGNGKSIAGNDDSGGGADAYIRFNVPEDGEYVIRVADHLDRGGPAHVYRVELAEVQDNLVLSVPYVNRNDSQTRQAMVIHRGNHFSTIISADRNNFRGDLEFHTKNLPPGVMLHADVMPGNQNQFLLVFEAKSDAPIGGGVGELLARVVEKDSKRDVQTIRRQPLDLVMAAPNNQVYYNTSVDGLAVAVAEEAPFRVRIEQSKAPIAQYGNKDLKIVVERNEGFDENVTVEFPYRPPGIGATSRITVNKDQKEAAYPISANANAETRSWKVAVLAYARVKGGTASISSPLADLEVVPRYTLGKIEGATAERGKSVKVVCKLEQKESFDGKAKIELLGLPSNTTAEAKEITKDSAEVEFDVVTTEKSPTGMHKQLFCRITVTKNGEPVEHTVATGGMLRIDAPKAPAGPNVAANAPATK
jgi:hypothetical protein